MKHFNRTITVLVFIFLYIPMIVLAVASFNTGTDIASFKGFTFRQYANLFRDGTLLTLLRNSVIIALLATLISTIVGTMAAVGIHSMKGRLRSAVMTMTNIPMTNPDIVTGVALALLFAFAGTILKTNSVLGFWTLLIAHITFNLPYVILNVMPKLQQMDKDLVEAALDLGCTPFVRMSGSGPMPMRCRSVLRMPVSSSMPTQASVRSRKLMHMGSMMSISRNRCVRGLHCAMKYATG